MPAARGVIPRSSSSSCMHRRRRRGAGNARELQVLLSRHCSCCCRDRSRRAAECRRLTTAVAARGMRMRVWSEHRHRGGRGRPRIQRMLLLLGGRQSSRRSPSSRLSIMMVCRRRRQVSRVRVIASTRVRCMLRSRLLRHWLRRRGRPQKLLRLSDALCSGSFQHGHIQRKHAVEFGMAFPNEIHQRGPEGHRVATRRSQQTIEVGEGDGGSR